LAELKGEEGGKGFAGKELLRLMYNQNKGYHRTEETGGAKDQMVVAWIKKRG